MKTILTVDDNEPLREALVLMVEMWAESRSGLTVNVVEKANGAEALAWINAHGMPDMVLLDVRMPVMGGAEFLRQTAQNGVDLRPRTLLLTGYADDLEEHLGTDALLMCHLRKPFMAPELFAAMDQLLAKI